MTLDYDLESLMESDSEMVSDYDNFDWENYPLPESVDKLRAELTPPSWLANPPLIVTSQHVDIPTNYRPDTP